MPKTENKSRRVPKGEYQATFTGPATLPSKGERLEDRLKELQNNVSTSYIDTGLRQAEEIGETVQETVINWFITVIKRDISFYIERTYFGGPGISIVGNLISVDIVEDDGLEFSDGELQVKAGQGIRIDTTCGVAVDIEDESPDFYSGLRFYPDAEDCDAHLGVKVKEASGLDIDSGGVYISLGCGLNIDKDDCLCVAIEQETGNNPIYCASEGDGGIGLLMSDGIDWTTDTGGALTTNEDSELEVAPKTFLYMCEEEQ